MAADPDIQREIAAIESEFSLTDSGLPLETVFLCFQIRSLDSSRFPQTPSSTLDEAQMKRIENALRYCLGL